MDTDFLTAAQVATELNELAWSGRAYVVARDNRWRGFGVGDGYGPEVNLDLFDGQALLDARRIDGQQWTGPLVKAEFTDSAKKIALLRLDHIRQAQASIATAVADARDAGCSWAQIGEALDVTKQAAQQRFGD